LGIPFVLGVLNTLVNAMKLFLLDSTSSLPSPTGSAAG
jgi:hypothetical protein